MSIPIKSLRNPLIFLLTVQSCGVLNLRRIGHGKSAKPDRVAESVDQSEEDSFDSASSLSSSSAFSSALQARVINHASDVGIDVQLSIQSKQLLEKFSYLVRVSKKNGVSFLRYVNWKGEGDRYETVDYNLNSGERYTYALVADVADFVIHPKLSVVVLAPLNLEVPRGQTLLLSKIAEQYPDCFSQMGDVKRLNLGRLLLAEDSQLLSEGSNWWLHVNYLGSRGGSLASFEKDRVAVHGMRGRDSGHLFLDIFEGQGLLNYVSRGENGGAGLKGFDGSEGSAGVAGKSAQALENSEMPNSTIRSPLCIKKATWGPVGRQGKEGSPGTDGQKGGNSENFSFRAAGRRSSDLQIQFESVAGVGGLGGLGGRGGLGGKRTLGKTSRYCPTPKIPVPIRGASGLNGKNGIAGLDGKMSADLCIANAEGLFRQDCFDPRLQERALSTFHKLRE